MWKLINLSVCQKFLQSVSKSVTWLVIYNFSRCYCKILLCWYVDSLDCRLCNYAKKLIFKEFVR